MTRATSPEKLTKEQKEKLRKKIKKQKYKENKKQKKSEDPMKMNIPLDPINYPDNIEVEYIENDEYLLTGKYYEEFKNVFHYFSTPKEILEAEGLNEEKQSDEDDDDEEEKDEGKGISRKQRKLMKRMQVAQLKAMVKRPDLVEAWDVSSIDPPLLIFLKSIKNSVAVPRHWSQKRKFLQNKRGILKPPFKLPDYIEATGISRLRDPFNDKQAGRLVRQKLRERMNPKLGKIDIDYEILHDAFFKYQTKPTLTTHGDIYFEGKEDEVKMKTFKPGKISSALRVLLNFIQNALGINEYNPPPFLINMQRYGPPPAYPNFKIPGVTSSLSENAIFNIYMGKEAGEDLTDLANHGQYGGFRPNPDDKMDKHDIGSFNIISDVNTLWGELGEEDFDEDEIDYEEAEAQQIVSTAPDFHPDQDTGISSVASGYETPDIEIRKKKGDEPLYTVLESIPANTKGVVPNTFGYVIPK